jgi:hypothetical protein
LTSAPRRSGATRGSAVVESKARGKVLDLAAGFSHCALQLPNKSRRTSRVRSHKTACARPAVTVGNRSPRNVHAPRDTSSRAYAPPSSAHCRSAVGSMANADGQARCGLRRSLPAIDPLCPAFVLLLSSPMRGCGQSSDPCQRLYLLRMTNRTFSTPGHLEAEKRPHVGESEYSAKTAGYR